MATNKHILGNPQGKGLIGTLHDLNAFNPNLVRAKEYHEWLADYFTSSLVLSAEFSFKPCIGTIYYLYLKENIWKLSLIEPQAWGTNGFGEYFAECQLKEDMSWCIEPKNFWYKDIEFLKTINQLKNAFIGLIADDLPLIKKLPFYLGHLSYYQRLYANSLARSLQKSLELKLGTVESHRIAGIKMIEELGFSKLTDVS